MELDGNSIDEAEFNFFAELQKLVAGTRASLHKKITKICSVDAHYDRSEATAVASLFELGRPRAVAIYRGKVTFPYVSGLFYLREGPFAFEAVRRLKVKPHLVCFDAHGIAHPRLAGLASLCGAALRIPSIGVAKSRLVGHPVGYKEGLQRLVQGDRSLGFVTTDARQKRYWSPGYSVSLRQLESIIRSHGETCLAAMEESDRLSKGRSAD